MNKRLLRDKYKYLRESLSLEEWREKSREICRRLINFLSSQEVKKIAFYHFINKEVDLTLAVEEFLKAKDREIYFPRVHSKEGKLTFHLVKSLTELTPGYMGIPEPPSTSSQCAPEDLEIVLVPGLAFDREKFRLGYGGGYYDRFLRKTKALKIGVAFSFQVQDFLPKESHDIKMDLILTEDGFF